MSVIRIDDTAVVAIFALVGGPALFVHGFRDLRLRRLIQNTPTAHIRSMAMGLVEINGVIESRSTVKAPFSGRACAYWQVDVSTLGRRNAWSVVHRDSSGHPFFLRDQTGLALIYPHDAQCKVNFATEEVCSGLQLPECYSSYLRTLGPQHLLWQVGAMRFRERVLEEGVRVYVLGTATPRAQVLTISEGEAMAATGTDEKVAGHVPGRDEAVTGVVRRGEQEKTFIISQESERTLTAELGALALAKLVGGPALTLFGLGYCLYSISFGTTSR